MSPCSAGSTGRSAGSPRRNRRWCVAADCGNRNRVRRHTERARAAADAAATADPTDLTDPRT
ncbi:CGNR zinc finger domain-containing protein [Herbiconiux sp. VKM Ac-1786]|uniref:CGNR zinc finger domain-containing protein n=1 Tax=Herbiconiux sp. VKM Ac-1786 TaxID=2783824 RepID=UPI00188C0254|nr:CGNR zinc finger domain-containing protein [Herbiconiux sp. VKM Ac-1786]